MIEDYTYLWYDVRPHPNFGTVEVRVMDAQTRVEHTLALAALVQAMVKELAEHFDAGKQLSHYPYEMLDENKWLAARHGLEGELVDLPKHRAACRTRSSRAGCCERAAPARRGAGLGRTSSSASRTCSSNGNGAARQVGGLRGQPRLPRGRARDRGGHRAEAPSRSAARMPRSGVHGEREPDLFVVCKNCGSEVSPYVTECPYCGQRVRKRAPKIDRGGAPKPPAQARARRPPLPRLRRGRDPGHRAGHGGPTPRSCWCSCRSLASTIACHRAGHAASTSASCCRPDDEAWRVFADAVRLHATRGYEFVALGGGRASSARCSSAASAGCVPILVFLAGGAAAPCCAVDGRPPRRRRAGANGAALGLLCAWLVDDRLAARRGEDRGNDLLGVLRDRGRACCSCCRSMTGSASATPASAARLGRRWRSGAAASLLVRR